MRAPWNAPRAAVEAWRGKAQTARKASRSLMAMRIGRSTAAGSSRRAMAAGQRAEFVAALYLRCKGYRILARRYCVRGGEIDLIARKGAMIAFIEVKYRPALDDAANAIDHWKRKRISRAASVWLAAHSWAATFTLRGDAIYFAPRRWPRHEIAAIPLDFG
jgi:putative endonuclease